jgi:hypothetical protein
LQIVACQLVTLSRGNTILGAHLGHLSVEFSGIPSFIAPHAEWWGHRRNTTDCSSTLARTAKYIASRGRIRSKKLMQDLCLHRACPPNAVFREYRLDASLNYIRLTVTRVSPLVYSCTQFEPQLVCPPCGDHKSPHPWRKQVLKTTGQITCVRCSSG